MAHVLVACCTGNRNTKLPRADTIHESCEIMRPQGESVAHPRRGRRPPGGASSKRRSMNQERVEALASRWAVL